MPNQDEHLQHTMDEQADRESLARELDEWAATEVMGWKRGRLLEYAGYRFAYLDDEAFVMWRASWHPSRDRNQLAEVEAAAGLIATGRAYDLWLCSDRTPTDYHAVDWSALPPAERLKWLREAMSEKAD